MATTESVRPRGIRFRRSRAGAAESEHVRRTADSVAELEHKEREPRSVEEHLGERITEISGTLAFVFVHVVWFASWMAWNLAPGLPHFDSFPFTFLTLTVSLEAIFLSTFVLISQNRQAERADRRAIMDLEVNVIAERELTKILKMVAEIHSHMSDESHDREVEEMMSTVHLDELKKSTEDAEARAGNGGPVDPD